jgi:hypothetical protein
VIYIVHLLYEGSQSAYEGLLVVVNNDIQVYSMFPARKKSVSIVSTARGSVQREAKIASDDALMDMAHPSLTHQGLS